MKDNKEKNKLNNKIDSELHDMIKFHRIGFDVVFYYSVHWHQLDKANDCIYSIQVIFCLPYE